MHSLDDYEQGDSLGAGGFADVYRAVHVATGKVFALKVSRKDAESLARIRREIEVQRRLKHANVLPILDWDREAFSWFVTEVAEGSAGAIHARSRLAPGEVVRLLEEVLGALGAAHRRDFTHRDLSPENILRSRGCWMLADWGYVRTSDASGPERLTRTGTGGGTFTWAAPEMLLDAHRADARADLYALGKIAAWFLVGGEPPGIGVAPTLPADEYWRAFLGKLTEELPDSRYQTAEEALLALSEVVAHVDSDDSSQVVSPAASGDAAQHTVDALKRFLEGPQHRIRLHDLVTRVTQETLASILSDRFDANRLDEGEALLARIDDYVSSCRTLMHVVFTGCYFGDADQEELWTNCVQRIATGRPRSGGYTRMSELQGLPALLVLVAGALGASLANRFGNFAAVTTRPVVNFVEQRGEVSAVARIGVSSVLDTDMLGATKKYDRRKTPGSDLLFEVFRDVARAVLVSDSEYETGFDRFEVLLGLVTIDAGGWAAGRFAWKNGLLGNNDENTLLARVRKEYESRGQNWPPLISGLFNKKPERVEAAFVRLTETAKGVSWG